MLSKRKTVEQMKDLNDAERQYQHSIKALESSGKVIGDRVFAQRQGTPNHE